MSIDLSAPAGNVINQPLVAPRKETMTFTLKTGPLVVDVWNPVQASDAPPVLLIHGWGGTGSYWESTAATLSQAVKVIVPDLPGTGRSQPVSSAQNMFDQVQSLVYLLDRMALDNVQVVGHSMGSAMALLLADAQPERVCRLVLTSLSFFLKPWEKQVYRWVMTVLRGAMLFRPMWLSGVPGMPQMMGMRYFHHMPKDDTALKQGLIDYLQLDYATATACADDAPSDAIPSAGARVRVPVLIIFGRHDQVMPPQNVDETNRIVPGSKVVWFEDCGHMPMIEKHDEYMSTLCDFLQL